MEIKTKLKKKFSISNTLLLVILACVFVMPAQVQATEAEPGIIDSGVCGDNLTWTLDEEGTLTISGEGDMYNYYWNDDYIDAYMAVDYIPEAYIDLETDRFGFENYAPWSPYGDNESIKEIVIENGVTSGSLALPYDG